VEEMTYILDDEEREFKAVNDTYFSELKLDQEGAIHLRNVYAALIPKERHHEPEVIEAKNAELDNWTKFNAYDIVEDTGQEKITCHWVINEKETHDSLKVMCKARLCLRGFMEHEVPRSDSPTAAREMVKTVLAIAANEKWNAKCMDVRSFREAGNEACHRG
jgi:hypothetical protein